MYRCEHGHNILDGDDTCEHVAAWPRKPERSGTNVITCSNAGCNSHESYMEDMISTQMIAGLYNKEHQSKVLTAAPTCKTFNNNLTFLADSRPLTNLPPT